MFFVEKMTVYVEINTWIKNKKMYLVFFNINLKITD